MEQLTKRILAIALIAVIGVGIGVGAWYLLSTSEEAGWETPGVSGIPSEQWIKVGYLGGLKGIQGAGGWHATWLCAYDINTKDDGVLVNGTKYYVAVKARDTNEHDPQLPISTGMAAAEKLIAVDKARYLLGGFRTEVTRSYLELAMDAKKIFFGCGASTDEFANNVGTNYERYKYYFRTTPLSSSMLGVQIFQTVMHIINKMENMTGQDINKVAIIREQLSWTDSLRGGIVSLAPYINYSVVKEIAYDISAPDFETYLNQIDAAGAQIIIPIISGDTGITFMKQYAITQPKALVFGIDVEGQMTTYWDTTNGACNYEVTSFTLTPGLNTTTYAPIFYADYEARFGVGPTIYTAAGAYGAVDMLAWAIRETQSFDELDIIAQLETLNKTAGGWLNETTSPRLLASPRFSFNAKHDVEAFHPWGTMKWGQWQNGEIFCIPTGEGTYYTQGIDMTAYGLGDYSNYSLGLYPDSLATGDLILPPWGINS
ncbi:MAG: ABC transporter substrate-binding protein [Promethearchaeota archaeon]